MKKIEYFVNWLFYVSLYFEKYVTRFLNYILMKPIIFFFSMFVPKRFHPPGIKHPELREEWNEIYGVSDAYRITFSILFANTFAIAFIILSSHNRDECNNKIRSFIYSCFTLDLFYR